MRLFLILTFIQTLLLPTFSAFPNDFDAYQWERQSGDAFYRGTVTLPDGTKHAFQTRENRLYFPSGSKVRVRGYAGAARPIGARTARREGRAPYVSPSYTDDAADERAYGDAEAILGDLQDEAPQGDHAGGISTADLCEAIEAAARLYLGKESISAKGGLSDFKGDSVIVGTLVDWSCRLDDNWSWRVLLGRHDVRLKQKETTPTGTSERTRAYDRTHGMIAGTRRAEAWEYGLGLSYARLPILKITQPTLNASQLKQRGFGAVTIIGHYAPASGPRAGLSLTPYAFGAKNYLAYDLEAGWRTLFAESWHWDLGIRRESKSVTVDSDCRDNPACRDNATTNLILPQAWMGVGKLF